MKRKNKKRMTVTEGEIHAEDLTPEQLYRALHTGFMSLAMPAAVHQKKRTA